jgi:hypothetical protein
MRAVMGEAAGEFVEARLVAEFVYRPGIGADELDDVFAEGLLNHLKADCMSGDALQLSKYGEQVVSVYEENLIFRRPAEQKFVAGI